MFRHCRRARRNQRGARRRGGRGRSAFYYVFCGFKQNYFGGLYRSESTLLLSRTVGEGGSAFDPQNGRGVVYDGRLGGLGIATNRDRNAKLWLVNTAESTASVWQTDGQGLREIASTESASKANVQELLLMKAATCSAPVAIDDQDDACRQPRLWNAGTLTKIAGHRSMPDRNNNGRIDTARDPEAMDYGSDECVLWTVPVGEPNAVLRTVAVDLGDDQSQGCLGAARKVWKLNPRDGQVLEEIDVRIEPYGMMIDALGRLWVSTLGVGNLQWVDTRQNEAHPVLFDQPRALRNGGQSSYGMAIDGRGRIWQNGWTVHVAIGYDPQTNEWCRVVLPDQFGDVGRGITVDGHGRVWTAIGGDGQSHLAWWHGDECNGGQSIALPRDQLSMPRGSRPDGTGR